MDVTNTTTRNVPRCRGITATLREACLTPALLETRVAQARSRADAQRVPWLPEYGKPVNMLSHRTARVVHGCAHAQPFQLVRRHEQRAASETDVTRRITVPALGETFVSQRPFLALTGTPYPVGADDLTRLRWYEAEIALGTAIKWLHNLRGLWTLASESLDFDGSSTLRCANCCRAVTRHARFERRASHAEFVVLRLLRTHDLLDWYALDTTVAERAARAAA